MLKISLLALITVIIVVCCMAFSLEAQAQIFGGNNETTNLSELYSKAIGSVVQVIVPDAVNTGFVYDKEGHIVTSDDAIADGGNITITFLDGSTYSATLMGNDSFSNLAVLSAPDVPTDKLIPLSIRNSTELRVGEQVAAIGNPFGLSGVLTEGVIGKLGALIPSEEETEGAEEETSNATFSISDVIVTDVPINEGSSGGPLLNIRGEVIGINIAVFSSTGEFAGISFSVPSNTIRKVIPSLITTGSYQHPWLGVSGYDITAEIAKVVGLKEPMGFIVTDIASGSPADIAGIQGGNKSVSIEGRELLLGGDIILGIDNKATSKIDDILSYLEREKQVGDNTQLTIHRNGEIQKVNMTLAARPSSPSIMSTVGPSSLSTAKEGLLSYENSTYGIRIQYPANWTKDEQDSNPADSVTNIITFYSPLDSRVDEYSENLGVSVENLTDPNITLEQYTESLIANYNESLTDFKVIESNTNTTLGGNSAYKLVYTDKEDDINYKTMEIGALVGDKVYFIEYIAEENYYSKYFPTIQKIIESVELVK
jgi:S1-C subfamily serine protease